MIHIEYSTAKSGAELVHTFSDTYMIRKVGTDEIYSDAWDLVSSEFTYEETDEPLPTEDPTENVN